MTENATEEMKAMARRIALSFYPETHPGFIGAEHCTLAAITEATEKCAELAEDRYVETDWFEPGKCIAAAIRSGKQYGNQEQPQ